MKKLKIVLEVYFVSFQIANISNQSINKMIQVML